MPIEAPTSVRQALNDADEAYMRLALKLRGMPDKTWSEEFADLLKGTYNAVRWLVEAYSHGGTR